MTRFRKKLRALLRRRQLDADLRDELTFHLEMLAEAGNRPDAQRRFENATSIGERCRDLWSFARIETFWQDVRYAARTFRRSPGFMAVAVIALALGIGADTAMFTIVSGAVSWNMGLDHGERVMVVSLTDATHTESSDASYPDFRDLRARVHSMEGLAAYQFLPVNVSDRSGLPERYYCVRTSANGNAVAHQKPLLGRDFTADDEKPGAAAVVLLGHHVWQLRYGGDPAIVGRTIRVDEVPMEVASDLVKPPWLILNLNGAAYGYLAAISIATGVLFGLAPALRLAKVDIHGSLKDGGYGTVGGRRSMRLATTLVAFEMALCVMLLAGAGLMIRSTANLYATPVGMNIKNVLTMRINLPEAKYAKAEDMVRFHTALATRLDALPGVEAAAVVLNLPLGGRMMLPYELAGSHPAGDRLPQVGAIVAAADYFRVGQVHARRGRLFTDDEGKSGTLVTVVNELFAAKTWPGENPVGKRIRVVRNRSSQPWFTVVGVVPDILQDFRHPLEHSPLIYLPYNDAPERMAYLVARTAVPPVTLAQAFRTAMQAMDEGLPVYEVRSLENRIAENRLTTTLFGTICTVFAAVALVLASIGLYSLTAHSVSRRMQEYGIRLAMGGTSGDILGLVLRQSLRPLAIGLIVGLPLAAVVMRLLRAMLAGVSPGDPVTFAGAATVLVLAGVAGCAIPARRAVRVDPMVVLRCE